MQPRVWTPSDHATGRRTGAPHAPGSPRRNFRGADIAPVSACQRPGRPRRRPDKLHADKGHGYPRCRRYLQHRGIKVRIARRGIESGSHPGRVRWVVERNISWLLRFKRLGLRHDRTQRTLRPLLTLACTLINLRATRAKRVPRSGLSRARRCRLPGTAASVTTTTGSLTTTAGPVRPYMIYAAGTLRTGDRVR
jgi:hypothetical protein